MKNYSYSNGNINIQINLDRFNKQFKAAQRYLDTAVLTDTDPFVPYLSGDLSRSAFEHTNIGSGEIIYNTEYAAYQYYGDNFNYTKEIHPLATSHWFEVSKLANKYIWIKNVKEIAGGK